jgi:hypothetical protein
MRVFDMFVLTKREQRVVVVFMLALVAIVLAKHYRDTGSIVPARPMPSPQISATPSPLSEEERAEPDDAR